MGSSKSTERGSGCRGDLTKGATDSNRETFSKVHKAELHQRREEEKHRKAPVPSQQNTQTQAAQHHHEYEHHRPPPLAPIATN